MLVSNRYLNIDKIGIAQWCLSDNPILGVQLAIQNGIKNIQLNLGIPGYDNYLLCDGILEKLRHLSLKFDVIYTAIAVNYINNFSSVVGYRTPEILKIIDDACTICHFLNIQNIIFPSFKERVISNKKDFDAQVHFFIDLFSDDRVVKLNIASENNLNSEQTLSFIEMIQHENFYINYDIYNPIIFGHDPVSIFEVSKQYILPQIHIKDGYNKVMGSAPLGRGDGEVSRSLDKINKCKIDTLFVLENKYSNFYINLQDDLEYVVTYVDQS